MPKIKDLGINVVPGTMRPPEIGGGGGGGGGGCQQLTITDFTASDDGCQCMSGNVTLTCDVVCTWGCDDVAAAQVTADPCTCQTLPGQPTTTITPHTPRLPAGMLSREAIAALREQLQQALKNLDVAERNLLPKSVEAVDAREKELQAELELLKARRDELKKKKKKS